jgi:hypothetical protein
MLLFTSLLTAQTTVHLRGKVVDFKSGEAIAKALVSIRDQKLESVTDNAGRFDLAGVQPGEVELYVTTVGYGLLKEKMQIPAGADMEVELDIGQEALKRTDQVTVTSGPFDQIEPSAPTEQTLQASELKEMSGLFGDPFRSLQNLPGVASSDDYYAYFAYRGAGTSNIAFYVDGALLIDPFHDLAQVPDAGSVSLLNGDIIDSVSLLGGAFPAKYGDSTAAVMNVKTREPGRDKVSTRISVDCFQAGVTAEGPLGRSKKAAWLVTARKSYLQYLMNRIGNSGLSIAYYDTEDKLIWNPSARHSLSLLAIYGPLNVSGADSTASTVGNWKTQSLAEVFSMNWQWTPRSSAILRTNASYNRENDNNNIQAGNLLNAKTQNFSFLHDATFQIGRELAVNGGAEARDITENYYDNYGRNVVTGDPTFSAYPAVKFKGQVWRYGAYLQPSWSSRKGRVMLTAGGRFDHHDFTEQNLWLPRASLAIGITSRTKLLAGYGQYAQFPNLEQLLGNNRNPLLRAQRATHYIAGLEQLISERIRFKMELYDREEQQDPYTPQAEWRLLNGVAVEPVYEAPLKNSVRGSSHGIEFSLQRVSANRLSGWVSYSLGYARYRDTLDHLYFDGDYDQRHTVNAFASYRLSKTVSWSGRFRYGSNFPVVGFFQGTPEADNRDQVFAFSSQRNQMRVPAYSRVDTRLNKAYYYKRSKMTVYMEGDNLLNHTNVRYFGLDKYNFSTGGVSLIHDKMLPILPSAGFTFEF